MKKINLTLKTIFTLQNLKNAYEQINKSSPGVDNLTFKEFESSLEKNLLKLQKEILNNTYTPEPLLLIEIPKDNNSTRPITIASIKDKIVQRLLYNELLPFFEKIFSNKSYAYRPNKSPLKAINRVKDFINRGNRFVLKSDIDEFFESINQQKLIEILQKYIEDRAIINLLTLFIKIGKIEKTNYLEHKSGVYQGDILSPLLSNIYLHQMDIFLEEQKFDFVRFADDFVILAKEENSLKLLLPKLKEFLKSINLQLNEEETYIKSVESGFAFLGVVFKNTQTAIENERFQKVISKLHSFAKEPLSLIEYIQKLNQYLEILEHYYFKLINQTQLNLLKEHLILSIVKKFYRLKKAKKINKKEIIKALGDIKLNILFQNPKEAKSLIISTIYSKLREKEINKKISSKKQEYSKKLSIASTLHIFKYATSLGVSKGKFVIKHKGKVVHTQPISKTSHIIIETSIFSISSKVIYEAAKNNIHIDFIDKNLLPYAQLTTYNSAFAQTIQKQASILNTKKHFELAYEFIDSKAKNQINYIKYINRYYKNLDSDIKTIKEIFKKLKKATAIPELMGYEGQISNIYWSAVAKNLDAPFEKRVTQNAKDMVNSALNYGYAILYNKVQYYLINAGLSLHISYLHSIDGTKPTLTYDLIEEFRTFIVDRVIFAMINKNEPIKVDKNGLLTKESRVLIAKNIKEKLGSYTTWRKESVKIENIIKTQAYNLKDAIINDKKYKGFIGKY